MTSLQDSDDSYEVGDIDDDIETDCNKEYEWELRFEAVHKGNKRVALGYIGGRIQFDDLFMAKIFKCADEEVREHIFKRGYRPIGRVMITSYKKYKQREATKFREIIQDQHIIADLWNVIYSYV